MNTAIDRVLKVPGFAVGGHLPAEAVSHTPAGKGVNLSRALARLGRSSIVTGFVGQAEAERFESFLNTAVGHGRVNSQLLSVRGPTRENITVVDPEGGTDTHLRTRGYALTDHDVARLTTKVGLLSRPGAVFVFAGSLPEGMDSEVLAGLVATAQGGGGRVVLDLDGQTLGEALKTIDGSVWMISPNRVEFAAAVGHDREMSFEVMLDAARLTGVRAEWVMVSMGKEGGLLVTQSGACRGVCEVDPGRVVSTVGSGDCLVAAVIDAQLRGLSPEEALRQGLAVATASTLNAFPADFQTQDVRELAESVHIESV